ncbi:MAG: hypothetical protein DLM63_09005 [Solirubrobacterales bacterium]|nr:MAG: hypothetical protein DLM63_09005 [Solirubrobacterales bacterium]
MELAALVRADDGLLAATVSETRTGPALEDANFNEEGLGALAASGSRARGHEHDYELLVEAIREGFQLHYGRGRVLAPEDPDLALLAGDRLYALGLARLAELGDIDGVLELADVIALAAQAQATGDGVLAEAVWRAGAAAIGWGSSADHVAAKALARGGSPGAANALQRAAESAIEPLRAR